MEQIQSYDQTSQKIQENKLNLTETLKSKQLVLQSLTLQKSQLQKEADLELSSQAQQLDVLVQTRDMLTNNIKEKNKINISIKNQSIESVGNELSRLKKENNQLKGTSEQAEELLKLFD